MDVILKVLEGSKAGAKVAIKKDEFLIGRSPKCHLCAGSTTISRRHCALRRKDAKVTIEDLKSRNGTLVNGEKIREEVELSSGDEISVGSLKFLITITHGINNAKKPQVKSVAEAVDRTAASGSGAIDDDDISKWLLETGPASKAVTETQTIQLDETNAVQVEQQMAENAAAETEHIGVNEEGEMDEASEQEAGKTKKQEPGKLPPLPSKPESKDSREAAMEALRNWNRRR